MIHANDKSFNDDATWLTDDKIIWNGNIIGKIFQSVSSVEDPEH